MLLYNYKKILIIPIFRNKIQPIMISPDKVASDKRERREATHSELYPQISPQMRKFSSMLFYKHRGNNIKVDDEFSCGVIYQYRWGGEGRLK